MRYKRTRKETAEMLKRHKKWPLGTVVKVITDNGYVEGKILKHCGLSEFWVERVHKSVCIVIFDEIVNYKGIDHYSHWLPFRSLKRVPEKSPEYGAHVIPWFAQYEQKIKEIEKKRK